MSQSAIYDGRVIHRRHGDTSHRLEYRVFSLFVNTTTAAGTALVMGFGAFRILDGAMTGGELLVVLTYVGARMAWRALAS